DQVLYRPISASVLSGPEIRTGGGSSTLNGAQNAVSQVALRVPDEGCQRGRCHCCQIYWSHSRSGWFWC
ncbi:unnamed protein product, partial [Caretta caretta]